jgi:Type II secretory pathway, component PulD
MNWKRGLAACCTALLLVGAIPQVNGQNRIIRDGVVVEIPGGLPGAATPPSQSPAPGSGSSPATGAWIPSEPLGSTSASTNQSGTGTNTTDEVQLSFQGANIDMVVQWLAQNTGKSVVKHPQVNCQLTINSSTKLKLREAVNLVYRALALEGFSAIEFNKSILIVPEGKEPRMSPELLDPAQKDVPEGRQRLVKVFRLQHIQAADLRERIRTALSDKATIDIDERANQIIITDYNDNIRAVGSLIETLDNERPEDVAVRVLPLKNVMAVDLVKAVGPLYQKRNTRALRDTVEVTADEQSNSLLIMSSESNFQAIRRFVQGLDTEEAQEKVMRTFTLKNADAQDVAKQLQDLNQEQTGNSRYIYYYSTPTPSGRNARKMKVVADRRRNAVIVQASPSEMESINKMIEELDEPVSDGSLAPKIYPLKYVNSVDIEDVLNELFLKKTQQRSYWDYYYDEYNSTTTDRDVGRLYGKVRITSEPHANALIVTANSKENLAAVEEVLAQLDVPSQSGDSTLRVPLKFAKASTVANQINILFAKNGSPPLRPTNQQQGQQGGQNFQNQNQNQNNSPQSGFDLELEAREDGYFPWLGGQPDNVRGGNDRTAARPVSDLVGRVRAVADHRGNALLISANVHYFPQLLKLVDQMDSPSDQVLIEARIVEVSSDFLDKLGVRWSPDGDRVFTADDYDNSFLASGSTGYKQGFGGNTTVNTPVSSEVAQALTSLRSGVVNGTISMDFLVQFLRKTTDATVLGNPQINVRDNETGRLFVGQQVPIQTSSQDSGANGLRQNFTYKNVGVILEVTPHINSAGDVELKIHAESSTVVPGVTVLGGAVFDTRTLRTDLRARDGQTLVLGGIIQRQISDTLRKTPILGDVPGLGWAFKKKDKTTREVELMVFLRPKIVRSQWDAQELMDEVYRRAPLLKESEEKHENRHQKK